MPRVEYKGITFDSELEIKYYDELEEKNIRFMYQNQYKKNSIKVVNCGRRKTYVPDFIVFDDINNIITIVELKGFNKWNGREDDDVMNFMKNKVAYDKPFLFGWLKSIGINTNGWDVGYQRIKHLKTYGFVDYDFKNPNTVANKRKEKIIELENELKPLRNRLKDIDRYFSYLQKEKLSKAQKLWVESFEKDNNIVDLHKQYWRDK